MGGDLKGAILSFLGIIAFILGIAFTFIGLLLLLLTGLWGIIWLILGILFLFLNWKSAEAGKAK